MKGRFERRHHKLVTKWRLLLVGGTFVVLYGLTAFKLWFVHSDNKAATKRHPLPTCPHGTVACPPPTHPGKCPLLIEAAKYAVQSAHYHMSSPSPLNVSMIQLLGHWKTAHQPQLRTVFEVFRHNQNILNVPSFPIMQPPRNDTSQKMPPPAYWKPHAMLQHCRQSELLLFLDGDVLIMNALVRIETVWNYYRHSQNDNNNELDVLVANDWNGYNTGVMIVNCTSPTATTFLELWARVALDVWQAPPPWGRIHSGWMEQNAFHFLLHSIQWQRYGDPSLVWDTIRQQRYGVEDDTFSSANLSRRIRHATQCTLNSYPFQIQRQRDSNLFVYGDGHFVVHLAGVGDRKRFQLLRYYLTLAKNNTVVRRSTQAEAAALYLERYNFSYHPSEVMVDWDFERNLCACHFTR